MKIHRKQRKLIYSVVVLIALIFVGVLGYMTIEGYSFIEALFMTIITISTVGYGVVRPLSEAGILFSTLLIIFSLILIALIIENFAATLLDEEVQRMIKNKRMKRKLQKLSNHVIVCGYGRNGKHAVEELLLHNEKVVVIELKHETIVENELDINEKVYAIEGDATNEETLLNANIKQAKALITTLPNDSDNVFVVLTAREFNPGILIISRASDDRSESKLRRAGANYVILPDSVGGHRMGKLVSQPEVIEFLDYLMLKSGETVNLEQIYCNDLPSVYIDKTLAELDVRRRSGANVIGIKLPDGRYIFNPGPDVKIQKNSILFVIGTPKQIAQLKEILKLDR